MKIFRTLEDMRRAAFESLHNNQTTGFVPTMGFLHEGHLSLVRQARAKNDLVGVSIYVNPTQFGPGEDLEQYPRDEKRDLDLLQSEGVDWVFLPSQEEIYPAGFSTYIQPPEAAQGWEGKTRPIHFRGVCSIVSILFHLTQPTLAYFGRKDAQQAAVIRAMTTDLQFPIEIIVCPTVRETDGLALSSRNIYLSAEERQSSLILSQTLSKGVDQFRAGQSNSQAILTEGEKTIHKNPSVKLDYLGIVDQNTFKAVDTIQEGNYYIGAMYVGKTRLIDNFIFER